jgi:Fic family protein
MTPPEKTQIHTSYAMEPLMPERSIETLRELACQLLTATGRLTGLVHSPLMREKIAGLVRGMNCYYSNLIEGHKTLPHEIERAMRQDYSCDLRERELQQLGLAHIEVDRCLDTWIKEPDADAYAPAFIARIHKAFYEHLPASMLQAKTRSGLVYQIVPGQWRDFMVQVGQHTPPPPDALPACLARFHAFYGRLAGSPDLQWVAMAAAHHRLAWIHPFGDGNGRVARLHTQALLKVHGLDGEGMWALSRGLARQRQTYYTRLAEADAPRRGDLDGRGQLSDQGLASFCRFFLETALDQVHFMNSLLELPTLRTRIERYFLVDEVAIPRYRQEIMKVVRSLVDEGEIARHRVRDITGKGATVSAEIIKDALAGGWIESPSPKGPLRIAFPAKVLPGYFPRLFLETPDT